MCLLVCVCVRLHVLECVLLTRILVVCFLCVCLTICLSVVGRWSATFFSVFARSDVAKKEKKKEVEKNGLSDYFLNQLIELRRCIVVLRGCWEKMTMKGFAGY